MITGLLRKRSCLYFLFEFAWRPGNVTRNLPNLELPVKRYLCRICLYLAICVLFSRSFLISFGNKLQIFDLSDILISYLVHLLCALKWTSHEVSTPTFRNLENASLESHDVCTVLNEKKHWNFINHQRFLIFIYNGSSL